MQPRADLSKPGGLVIRLLDISYEMGQVRMQRLGILTIGDYF